MTVLYTFQPIHKQTQNKGDLNTSISEKNSKIKSHNKMERICYVCNHAVFNWCRNLTEIKSAHSNTVLIDFIQKFLGDFKSQRQMNDVTNCICLDCLERINAYDLTCQHALQQENQLRDLLLETEMQLQQNYAEAKPSIQSIVNVKSEVEHEETVFAVEVDNLTVTKTECNDMDDEPQMEILASTLRDFPDYEQAAASPACSDNSDLDDDAEETPTQTTHIMVNRLQNRQFKSLVFLKKTLEFFSEEPRHGR